ncbi:3-hydroxyacyl-CoA dehydrogenase [Microbacterium sediminis]|uniref:3-hydroxyacyl-CoA dehydrogenase n=1 Tax=Microbacterium sediminis TaxID=904291 RepID=A0A1B9NDG6_9MICO|nr:3-hydroxyacyl-CoA dehydrogenase [Microbacterium sediminis]OCG74642.1 3-hydroxyacyl-CoA dehydrogenase [Microbacterium sediminis]QBR74938.1 3-hydroxyacyl-CoA dehydrogenase [Microbacterium sediminis]
MTAPLAVLGGGSIGVAFALQFALAGRAVRVYEPSPDRRTAIPGELRARLAELAAHGLLDDDLDAVAGRVVLTSAVAEAVAGAAIAQECAPERAEIKRALFAEAAAADPDAILASSSSAIVPSAITGEEPWADRLIVAHPGNPPYLIPVIELVPGPRTAAGVIDRAAAVYEAVGLRPVRLTREIEGFVFNRLQGAVLREAYCLLRDGIASVDDIDAVMREGLGRRWSFMGPFETSDLNVRGGLEAHAARMAPAYERMGAERGQHDPWTPELVAEAHRQRREILPLEEWEDRVLWRDRELMRRKRLLG